MTTDWMFEAPCCGVLTSARRMVDLAGVCERCRTRLADYLDAELHAELLEDLRCATHPQAQELALLLLASGRSDLREALRG